MTSRKFPSRSQGSAGGSFFPLYWRWEDCRSSALLSAAPAAVLRHRIPHVLQFAGSMEDGRQSKGIRIGGVMRQEIP